MRESGAMALPNLGTLSLRPAAVPPTGEFWSLSREEADERNKYGGVERFTHEEYVKGGEYFRVRYKYRNPPSFENPDAAKYLYDVFDAEKLWEYTRKRGLNPVKWEKIWREDWRELRDKYAPGAPEPGFVARLPRLGATVFVYEGGRTEGRLVRKERPGMVRHYEGDKGEEHHVRTEFRNGVVKYLKGDKGKEHAVRQEFPNGEVQHYEGDKDDEYMVRSEFPDGEVQHYEGGGRDLERAVRTVLPDGTVWYFEGGRGVERVVRIVHPDGTVVQ